MGVTVGVLSPGVPALVGADVPDGEDVPEPADGVAPAASVHWRMPSLALKTAVSSFGTWLRSF